MATSVGVGSSGLRRAAALALVATAVAGAWLGPRLARWLGGWEAERQRAAGAAAGPLFGRLAASQVGYGPADRKEFSAPRPFRSFSVLDERDGTVALRGGPPLREVATRALGPVERVWIGDFTGLRAPGRYRIVADDGTASHPFAVGPAVFDPAVRAVQRAFYYQRAFTAVVAPHAEGPWVHGSDAGLAPPGERMGWHDAGDLSIYNASATTALFWLLSAWADFAPASDDTNIPESGNGVPDLLDEARWGLEWMLSVQGPDGGFRNTTCQERYGAYGTVSPEGAGPYRSGEEGTIPTGRAVGTLAWASAVYRPADAAFAARCLAAAERGYRYLEERPGESSDGPTCPAMRQDGDPRAGREVRAYAAAGMLVATARAAYAEDFERHREEVREPPGFRRTGPYAALLYLRAAAGDARRKEAIRARLRELAGALRADAAGHPFQWASAYHWGSIGAGFQRTGAFSARACLDDPSGRADDCEQALANVHYALGRNLLQLAYVSGLPGVTEGRRRGFHHWLAALRAEPFLFPGMVAGGPAEAPEPDDRSRPGARPVPVWGYWGDPAMPRDRSTPLDGRYTDNDSWSTNEMDVDWQGVTLYNLYLAQWWARRGAGGSVLESAAGSPGR